MSLAYRKIEVYPGINDNPVEPTDNKAGNGSHLIEQYNGLIDQLVSELDYLGSSQPVYPRAYTHWHQDSKLRGGDFFNHYLDTNQYYGMLTRQNPAALNDSWSFGCCLAQGQYQMRFLGTRGNDHGRITLLLNESQTNHQIDFYDTAAITYNSFADIYFFIPFSGYFTFRFVVDKNSNSSGYKINLTKINLQTVGAL